MTPKEKKEKIAFHIEKVLGILGLDLTNPSLAKTPERVAKMYVDEIFSGLNPETYPKVALHKELISNECVLVKNISLISFCEHHLMPMMGRAHIAYLPTKGVLGLSKIHQILRYYAKRPQLQERLTEQVVEMLKKELQTENVAIAIHMKHLCLLAHDVEDQNSEVETYALRGCFETDRARRSEFFLRITECIEKVRL